MALLVGCVLEPIGLRRHAVHGCASLVPSSSRSLFFFVSLVALSSLRGYMDSMRMLDHLLLIDTLLSS